MQTLGTRPGIIQHDDVVLILLILNNALNFLTLVVFMINTRRNGK